ncbi:SRPBCC family protein [Calditrichota bacterium LG25]
MKTIKATIVIKASPHKVWQILRDINTYTFWNPFIIYGRGEFAVGKKFSFILKAPGEKPKFFKSIFKKIEENKEVRWLKKSLLPGFYNVEHLITLNFSSEDETTLEYRQHFSGLLAWWFFDRLEYSYMAGMKKMNQALKEMCEQEGKKE